MTPDKKLHLALRVVEACRAVRRLQREFFRTKNPITLRECKDAERRLDAALEEFDGSGKPGLFDPDLGGEGG